MMIEVVNCAVYKVRAPLRTNRPKTRAKRPINPA